MTKVSQGFHHHINQIQSGVVDCKCTDTEHCERMHERLEQPRKKQQTSLHSVQDTSVIHANNAINEVNRLAEFTFQ